MKVALIYPPPWKTPAPAEPPYAKGEGPPEGYREGDLDADFHQTPYGLFALGAAALFVAPGFLRVGLLSVLVFVGLGAISSGGLLAGRYYLSTHEERGIVLPDELAVKEGPDANNATAFLVHAGLKLRIVEHDGDWLRVRLGNGLEGWTRERDVGKL
jgi:hypothetical protein